MARIDRILFGDNQFFGVNHMSEEKARAQAAQFKDTAAIMKVLDDAYDVGLKVFMCTTHDRVGEIADIVRANPGRYFFANMAMALHLIEQGRINGLSDRAGKFVQVGTIDPVFTVLALFPLPPFFKLLAFFAAVAHSGLLVLV